MSTRKEIENRKTRKRTKTLVQEYPTKIVDIKIDGEMNEESFIEDISMNSKRLDELVCSGLYNVSYSGSTGKVTLYLKDKTNLGDLDG